MSNHMQQQADSTHAFGYGLYVKVWLALVALTAALVALSLSRKPNLALLGLLAITPTKASLVFYYFMHLKYESVTLKYMVAAALGVLVIFIGLTFSDYLYR